MTDPLEFLALFFRDIQEHREAHVERIVDRTYAQVPGYAGVPRDDFAEATRQTVDFLTGAYTGRRMPSSDDWRALDEETVRRRVRQGVTAKDWLAHGRVFKDLFVEAAIEFGGASGISEADVYNGMLTLQQGADEGTAFAAAAFDRVADELLREDEAARREFMGGLLRGALTPAAMRDGAAAIGLDPAALYCAVRVRPLDHGNPGDLLRIVLRSEPTVDPRGAWAALDGDVCGISQEGPPAGLDGAAAGVGPAVPLEAVGSSFAAATTALETAHRFSLAGAYRLEDVGVLAMAASGGRAGDAVVERFVAEVERSGSGGRALVETVAAYLEHGLQVGVTAKTLHLHVNSLRKRLRRYEELTGSSLSSMDDLAAIWLALKRRELDGPSRA